MAKNNIGKPAANRKDIAGKRFGRLTAITCVGIAKCQQSLWQCTCDCGAEKIIMASNLLRGLTQSCGCFMRERSAEANIQHGHRRRCQPRSPTGTYITWAGIVQRCNNSNDKSFANYGGRGITVCTRWRSFENFLADMGERPEGTSIDRINNDGNYEPGNCRWATRSQQNINRRKFRRNTAPFAQP